MQLHSMRQLTLDVRFSPTLIVEDLIQINQISGYRLIRIYLIAYVTRYVYSSIMTHE